MINRRRVFLLFRFVVILAVLCSAGCASLGPQKSYKLDSKAVFVEFDFEPNDQHYGLYSGMPYRTVESIVDKFDVILDARFVESLAALASKRNHPDVSRYFHSCISNKRFLPRQIFSPSAEPNLRVSPYDSYCGRNAYMMKVSIDSKANHPTVPVIRISPRSFVRGSTDWAVVTTEAGKVTNVSSYSRPTMVLQLGVQITKPGQAPELVTQEIRPKISNLTYRNPVNVDQAYIDGYVAFLGRLLKP